jgi:hypothetical protein
MINESYSGDQSKTKQYETFKSYQNCALRITANDPSHDHDIMRSPGVWSPEMENI